MSAREPDSTQPQDQAEIDAQAAENEAWRAETFARCKRLHRCADEFGFRWRYHLNDADRAGKCKGRCACQERSGEAVTFECDFSLSVEIDADGTKRPGPPFTITILPKGAQ